MIAARSPEPVLARALLDVARQAGVHTALDELLDVHLMGSYSARYVTRRSQALREMRAITGITYA